MLPFIAYGGDYNPEQWSPEVWQEDARLMREAGVNLVSLGIFAWAKLEPAPGEYDFKWLDQVMNLLHAQGVSVNLATPTASPPPWFVQQHPESLPVTADGVTLWHGSRRHYCPHNTAYRERAASLVTGLARHVRGHPALVLWHVDNEYACHVSECFCDVSAAAFRVWLERRYGTLDALNHAWGTAFWSQHYSDWEEIAPPRRAPTFINPTELLDWQRFCSDSWLACFEDQRAILRETTPDVPITTNFMRFFKPLDYWAWAAREDIVSDDKYPDLTDPEWMIEAAMACDLQRSLKQGAPWLLMEQAPTHVNWRERNATKPPGMMRLGSYQALARGANGILFFQWRASQAGAEKFHSGMVPHIGTDSRVWREVKALGEELGGLDAPSRGLASAEKQGLHTSRVKADVAILFSWENWWALELPGKPLNDLQLLDQVKAIYAELYRRNITVDFAPPDADLSAYRLVIAPHLYLVSDRAAHNIERYVGQGGTLLMTFLSGIVDPNEHIRLGGYPALFRHLLGLWVEEFVAYGKGQSNAIKTVQGETFACDLWSDIIHPTGAEVLACYEHDYFADAPALTRHSFGNGMSYYLGTNLNSDGLAWVLAEVCAQAGVQPVHAAPRGVEITERTNSTHRWLFVLNYSDEAVEIEMKQGGRDLISGAVVKGLLRVEARGVGVVEYDRM